MDSVTALDRASHPSQKATTVVVNRFALRWIVATLRILADHIETNLMNHPEEQPRELSASETPAVQGR